MLESLKKIYSSVDTKWMMEHTKELTDIEYGQTFENYAKSSQYVYNLLKEEGFEAQLLTFPADGKTVYQDKRSPLAWRATKGKLTVLSSAVKFVDPVVADFEKMPFSLIKHSVSTPEGGIKTKLITKSQVFAGEDCNGALILLGSEERPTADTISPLLDMGALGFVNDYLSCGDDTPDCVQWVNAATDDSAHWHVQSEDRDFIGFSVSPRIGRKLRYAASVGAVNVLVESDGERYEGEINAVTAILPGKSKKEIWAMAHMYEPLATDNSSGVILLINALRHIREMIRKDQLEYSIRLVFAAEVYGFAAVADRFGGKLHDIVIGGINSDAVPIGINDGPVKLSLMPYATPFFGNYITELVGEAFCGLFGKDAVSRKIYNYDDDKSLGDSTVGLPTVWPIHDTAPGYRYWHNSRRSFDYIDEEKFGRMCSLYILWLSQMVTLNKDKLPELVKKSAELAQKHLDSEVQFSNGKNRMKFILEGEKARLKSFDKIEEIPETANAAESLTVNPDENDEISSPWLDYAEGIVPARATVGFPQDLVKLPKNKRKLPDGMIYGPMANIMSLMDGKRTLKEIICGALWEDHMTVTDKLAKKYVNAVMYLADAGYVSATNKNDIDKQQIKEVLKKIGVLEGDTLLVHSGLSGCGHIMGGEDAVIDAFVESVGENGGVMFPSFNYSFAGFSGVLNKSKMFRPYSEKNIDAIWTGSIPKAVLRRKGAKRSAHATHSWCGFGEKARICLEAQGQLDPPASETSPMAKALELGGKVVFFGCTPSSNTFVHFLEDQAKGSYLENAIVRIEDEDGRVHTELIPRHLPGCRDFYNHDITKVKFYQRATARGLEIKKEKLGAGYVYYMELKPLYEIGTKLFKEDKNVTLCDNPDCSFCKKYR